MTAAENLTIDSLARELHEILWVCNRRVGLPNEIGHTLVGIVGDMPRDFDALPADIKEIRMRAAGMLIERIMR